MSEPPQPKLLACRARKRQEGGPTCWHRGVFYYRWSFRPHAVFLFRLLPCKINDHDLVWRARRKSHRDRGSNSQAQMFGVVCKPMYVCSVGFRYAAIASYHRLRYLLSHGEPLYCLRVRISADTRTSGSGRVGLNSEVSAWPTLEAQYLADERDLRVKRPSRGRGW